MPAVNLTIDHYRKVARRRTRVAAAACAVWLAAIGVRLVQIQIFGHAQAQAKVIQQNQSRLDIQARRGTIFDRNGRILARSLPVRSPYYVTKPGETFQARLAVVRQLDVILKFTPKEMEKIREELRKRPHLVFLKRKIDPDLAARVVDSKIGIGFQEDMKRLYPLNSLACQILGGVNSQEDGNGGIESKFNGVLQGKRGEALNIHDAHGHEYRYEVVTEPENGRDIGLTLDATLQYYVQDALRKAVASSRSAWGTAIVSDPNSGDILAMASIPDYDPNGPYPAGGAEINRAIQYTYEPGSTFKMVTAAAALENRVVTFADKFDCREGSIKVPGGPIRDHKTFGILSFADVIVHSSNVGAIMVGQRLSPEEFYSMVEVFGFGRRTGIELPAEEPGRFDPIKKWSRRSQYSLSIGYEISVTPLQILQAANLLANLGKVVPLRIVRSVQGSQPRVSGNVTGIALSKATCEKVVGILESVVREGTGTLAAIPGYDIAGKTGTTQKYDPELKAFSSRRHTASFVGFVPADKPVLSIIVVLDDPKTDEQYGGQIAAPVFREIAVRALRLLEVRPKPGPPLLASHRVEREEP